MLSRKMYENLVIVIFLACSVLANSKIDELKKRFQDENTGVFVENNDLESKAKSAFRKFLASNSLVQKERIESYFADWRKCVDLNGPFDTEEKRNKALYELMNPSYFQASLFMEQLLQNRDDTEEAIKDFKKGIISEKTGKVQLYFSGDGDIINAVVVISELESGQCVVLTYISD